MTNAGDYWIPFVRMICTRQQEGTYGQKEPTYTPGQALWGYVTEKGGAEITDDLGRVVSRTKAFVNLRGYPEITEADVLFDPVADRNLKILGLWYGPNETILQVYTSKDTLPTP